MYEVSPITLWLLLALSVVAICKYVVPACFKLGVLAVRTIFLFLCAKQQGFPMAPILKRLPKLLWRVWRKNFIYSYDYTNVCRFNFREGVFESILVGEHEWLHVVAMSLRNSAENFTVTANQADGSKIVVRFKVRTYVITGKPVKVMTVSELHGDKMLDAFLAHAMESMVRVVAYYCPAIGAIMVNTQSDTLAYISTLESYAVSIEGKTQQLFYLRGEDNPNARFLYPK